MTKAHWGEGLVKQESWYMGPVKQWETDLYGYELASGYGDFITNNCKMILKTRDKSEWAYNLMVRCFDLLARNKRWPHQIDDLIPSKRQCKTRLCSLYNKTKFRWAKRLGITVTCKSRSHGDMTRDPYIAAIACAIYLNRLQFINISIPWYLYRGTTWTWHKYLKNPTDRNRTRWERAERRAAWFKVKDFVTVLVMLRREAVERFSMNLTINPK